MIDLRQMRQFVAVAEALSFRRAAEQLNMSQPPLSQAIQRLEADIGAKLFHRSKRQVTLTRAGEVMLEESHRVLDQADRAVSHIRDVAHGHMGRVEIGFVLTASYELLPRVTRAFRRANPNIHVELHSMNSADMIRALQERHIDIAFLRPPLAAIEHLSMTGIYGERLAAILPENHPLADQERVDLADLTKPLYVMVPMPGWHTPFQTRIVGVCQANGIEPEIIHDPIHLVSMIAAGMGAGIGPRTSRRLQLDGVVFRELDGVPDDLHMELAMAWRTNAASRVTTAFRETAIEVARDLYPTMDEDRPLFKDSVG
ncbi:MAG: LysR substrate-binding domain-containing protein [Rhodospirillaceae bacterium]|nr:LysR substrate-binding domain-containing protein [Rhodospirillaceae bacterium]MDD9925021.1 LysR substrate-binding domain-containing protein [Rhodospirillaceae bacterium]